MKGIRIACMVTGLAAWVALAGGCTNASPAPGSKATGDPGNSPTGIAAAPPEIPTIRLERSPLSQQVKLPAQLAAFEEVSIFPKVNGYVKNVWVDVGSRVRKGQLLMDLEAPELEQATTQAKERYARAKLDATISEQNYQRMKVAAETPGAVSPMNLASLKAKADADSALCNAEHAN